jgi:serine/threonine-protein kinase RsbW
MSDSPFCEFDASKLLLRLDLTIPSTRESVLALIEQIMGTVNEMGCAENRKDDVHLALEEALMNALMHGCKGDPDKEIQCCVACEKDKGMLIVVRDPGPGFDPASVPSPVVGQNVFSEHGRGIFLINQMVDEVKFDKGGTEIRMRIK